MSLRPSQSSQQTRYFRSQRHRAIGGVCAGIAITHSWSIVLVRIIALVGLQTGLGILVYLVLWAVMPPYQAKGSPEPVVLPHDPLTRNQSHRIVGGVCGGLAKFLGWDPLIVRILFVVFHGISIVPYIYALIVLPVSTDSSSA